jgi:outer membrane protein OmpA-like peptidoglycan-associated protein
LPKVLQTESQRIHQRIQTSRKSALLTAATVSALALAQWFLASESVPAAPAPGTIVVAQNPPPKCGQDPQHPCPKAAPQQPAPKAPQQQPPQQNHQQVQPQQPPPQQNRQQVQPQQPPPQQPPPRQQAQPTPPPPAPPPQVPQNAQKPVLQQPVQGQHPGQGPVQNQQRIVPAQGQPVQPQGGPPPQQGQQVLPGRNQPVVVQPQPGGQQPVQGQQVPPGRNQPVVVQPQPGGQQPVQGQQIPPGRNQPVIGQPQVPGRNQPVAGQPPAQVFQRVQPAPGQPGWGPAGQPSQPGARPAPVASFGNVQDLRGQRHEHTEPGGRVVIEEPDHRQIVREGGQAFVRHDENERLLAFGQGRRERRDDGEYSIIVRPDGDEIITVTDDDGRLIRRFRREHDGREDILIDNRRPRGERIFLDLPLPIIGIPQDQYIVDTGVAPEPFIYQTLAAPPLVPIERPYSLDEIRYNVALRDRMRRIDVDTINFDLGSWEVGPDQVERLQLIAQAIQDIVARNPNEIFLVEGHTDAVGNDVDNLSLSDRRAETVAGILTENFQIPPENLTSQGYGSHYLKIPTPEANRQNRRVTVRRITPLLNGGNG